MLLIIRMLLLFGFVIQPNLSAKFCVQRYVNGQWITKGDCGGSGSMSGMQKELQLKAEDEKKKPTADKKWTVFQRRKYGNVDFNRGWADYVNGFGTREGDLWLGLETMHQLTKGGNVEMKIKMITKKGIYSVAKYSDFRIGPGPDNYRLQVSGYSGNATYGDGLKRHNNQTFLTKGVDHDDWSRNCVVWLGAGWWYRNCNPGSNLNGNFHKTGYGGFWWYRNNNLLRFSEMKFRKRP